MDKNQTIGIVLMSVLFVGYMWISDFNKPQEIEKPKTEQQTVIPQENKVKPNKGVADQEIVSSKTIEETNLVNFEEKKIIITTQDVEITFSNNGGKIEALKLLNHTDQNDKLVQLFDDQTASLSLSLNTVKGDLNVFDGGFNTPNKNATVKEGDTLEVVFTKSYDKGQYIQHIYKVAGSGFLIDYNIEINGFKSELKDTTAKLSFTDKLRSFEKAIKVSRQQSTITYYGTKDGFDNIGASSEDEVLEEDIEWFTFKQRFFNSSIIPSSPLTNVHLSAVMSEDDPKEDAEFEDKSLFAQATLSLSGDQKLTENIKFYFGPNDYRVMKNIAKNHGITDFSENVYLGWKVFSIINKWLVIPLFRFLEGFNLNYGVIILILVVVIKMLLFPIAYKSYLSMAKMKELKPEIEEIKERLGDDSMGVQQEQMKLYKQVGVSPISGCIPMVLQMPIFLALFNFFPNFIELRHESFLWATDLSSYDNLISWEGIPIPFLGNHISIFTVLMTISTIAYTYYNNQMNAAAQQGPMKMMGYLMPVVFFFVLNDFAAGLTWYYFVSNLITITQQKVASSFIDKDKIRLKMEENKKAYVSTSTGGEKKSGFRQRLEEAQKAKSAAAKEKKK
jgi:YidC/Oxa1 family membrane protein insertase